MITGQKDRDTHCNLFDHSCTDYFPLDPHGQFDIKFDCKMFEPPRQILKLEKLLQAQEQKK